MKLAIAATSQDTDAQVAVQAARAPFYMFYDEKGTLLDVIANPFRSIDHGAAPRAIRLLKEHSINTLVAEQFGDRFLTLLKENNNSAVTATGSVSKAIQKLLSESILA